MSIEHHSISVHFVQTLVNAMERRGVDARQAMLDAGLNPELLQVPQLRVTPEQFSQLIMLAWLRMDDELLGLGSQSLRYGVFSLMARQAVHCKSLKSALYHIARFYNLVADAITLTLDTEGDEAWFDMQLSAPEKDPDHALCELLMMLWHRFPSWLIGQKIQLKEIWFTWPEPAHSAEYRLIYPCRIRYEQPVNRLVMERRYLQAPVVQTKQTLQAYLRSSPLNWFKRQAYYPVFTRKVVRCLEKDEGFVSLNMEQIAAELNVTSRTLRRKLTEEGTSFQQLKDGLRRDAAIHYLSQPGISVAEISRRLGFSEPAAFTRAFKQWTGVPPAVYRQT